MEWMLDIQLGRRNLSPIQRIAVAEKYRPIYEKQAQTNLREGGRKGGLANSSKPSQNSSKASNIDNDNKVDVRAKLAKTAGVSTDTYSKGKKILDSNNEGLKQEVLSGEKVLVLVIKNLHKVKMKIKFLKILLKQTYVRGVSVILIPLNLGRCIKELECLYGIKYGNNQHNRTTNNFNSSKTQEQLAKDMGMTVQNLQNYKMLADMIPELDDLVQTGILAPTTSIDDDLQDENSKLRALISNNFGRRKNDPAKDRKALATYVELKGYGQGRPEKGANLACFSLDEIAKGLNMSKRNLQRALRIERNLTDSMKELCVYYALIISCVKDFDGDLGF